MLKGLDTVLNADVLHAIKSAGHADEIVISDLNFPSDSVARQTVLGRLLRMENISSPRAIKGILSLMPLDSFVEHGALRMQVDGAPDELPPVQREVQAEIDAAEGRSCPLGSIGRMEFYERARKAYCVIQTGENRFWGCIILKKGVIPPS
ncbi:MAG: RbsD/FucU domain-containing protein [Hyphomicrobium sp.]